MSDGKGERPSLSLRDMPKEQPIFIADLARAFGWRTERMRRKLFSIHTGHEAPVVIRVGGRWAVCSINRLREVWNGVGERGLTVEELTDQLVDSRKREEEAQERNRDLRTEITRLRARQRATETRIVEVELALVKATHIFSALAPTDPERPTPGAFLAEEDESGVRTSETAISVTVAAKERA